jgi:hypothetical protein
MYINSNIVFIHEIINKPIINKPIINIKHKYGIIGGNYQIDEPWESDNDDNDY